MKFFKQNKEVLIFAAVTFVLVIAALQLNARVVGPAIDKISAGEDDLAA